jgi:hypothetical protein
MSNRLPRYLVAGALLAALAVASPALANKGGGGGGIGGGGARGMGGGMAMGGGAMRFSAAPLTSRAAFTPALSHFQDRNDHPHRFAFRDRNDVHHRHRLHRLALFGASYYDDYPSYDDCWRRRLRPMDRGSSMSAATTATRLRRTT